MLLQKYYVIIWLVRKNKLLFRCLHLLLSFIADIPNKPSNISEDNGALEKRNLNEYSLVLHWQPPNNKNSHQLTTNYNIRVQSSSPNTSVYYNNTNTNITLPLYYNDTYNVTITAVSCAGESEQTVLIIL